MVQKCLLLMLAVGASVTVVSGECPTGRPASAGTTASVSGGQVVLANGWVCAVVSLAGSPADGPVRISELRGDLHGEGR